MAKEGYHFGGSSRNLPDNRTPSSFDRSLVALFNNSNCSLVTTILIFVLLHPSWRTIFEGTKGFPRRPARSGTHEMVNLTGF
ncbi:hypothetical protein ACFX2F_037176 [Malus domestica]